MGVGPTCWTSLSTGLSQWELGYIAHSMQNGLLQISPLTSYLLHSIQDFRPCPTFTHLNYFILLTTPWSMTPSLLLIFMAQISLLFYCCCFLHLSSQDTFQVSFQADLTLCMSYILMCSVILPSFFYFIFLFILSTVKFIISFCRQQIKLYL